MPDSSSRGIFLSYRHVDSAPYALSLKVTFRNRSRTRMSSWIWTPLRRVGTSPRSSGMPWTRAWCWWP